MKIGQLIEQQDGSMSGYICTLHLNINFNLEKNPDRNQSDKSPGYIITAGKVDLGAAWVNTSSRTGEVYMSLEMDDMSFPDKLKCAAFKNQDNTWRIVWDRQKKAEPVQEKAAA